MDIVGYFKEISLAVIAFGTIVGFFVDTFNKFFIETVKFRYKDVPVKQSRFEIAVTMGVYCITILSIIISIFELINTWILKGNNNSLEFSWSVVIGFIFVCIWIFYEWALMYYFIEIRTIFIHYLEENEADEYMDILKEKYRKNLSRIRVIASIYVAISAYISLIEGIDALIFFGLFGISGLITIIISSNLKNVIDRIISKKETMLYTSEKEIIFCKCYLEYDEYYLVFKDGVEMYIRKSDIKKKRQ